MLYLTLKDDPFPDQEHDENALLEVSFSAGVLPHFTDT